ncbi:MAG: response regulator transcription factor [Gammaproteobacteria bacterium]
MQLTDNTIIVAEDAPRDREFLAGALPDFKLILANDGQEAVNLLKSSDIHFVISDLQMPNMNGIELAHAVWEYRPNARIVFWSHYKDEIYLRSLSRIIPADTVYGYVLKDSASDILIKAVRQVFIENQCWIDPKIRSVQARGQRPVDNITDAEYEVLIDIALGLTDNIIARRHYLSRRGVQSRLKSLYQKLNIERSPKIEADGEVMNPRSRAVAIAFQRGLINSEELASEEKRLDAWFDREGLQGNGERNA